MLQIKIPIPCHEDWNAMKQQEIGRHCDVCVKTVVDFTSMTDDEVRNYLLQNKGKKLCGRFTSQQVEHFNLQIPASALHTEMNFMKKFALASLIIFGSTLFSCQNHEAKMMNKVEVVGSTAMPRNNTGEIAGTIAMPTIMGEAPPMMISDTVKCNTEFGTIKGDISIEPPPPPMMGIIAISDTTTETQQIDTAKIMGTPIAINDPKKDTIKKDCGDTIKVYH
jgi:hypothetical protein